MSEVIDSTIRGVILTGLTVISSYLIKKMFYTPPSYKVQNIKSTYKNLSSIAPAWVKETINSIKNDNKFNGILLYGPPGNGKNMIGQVIAKESNATFFYINPGKVSPSKTLSSSEKINNLFAEARQQKSVIFIDEIDGFYNKDNINALYAIQTELDGEGKNNSNITCIGATNYYDQIQSSALLRKGRLANIKLVDNPNSNQRKKLIKHCYPFIKDDKQKNALARMSKGLSNADIAYHQLDSKYDSYDKLKKVLTPWQPNTQNLTTNKRRRFSIGFTPKFQLDKTERFILKC